MNADERRLAELLDEAGDPGLHEGRRLAAARAAVKLLERMTAETRRSAHDRG